jgi:hypothetical protein
MSLAPLDQGGIFLFAPDRKDVPITEEAARKVRVNRSVL